MTGDQPAACAGHREPLWDATVDGETEQQQAARHARAVAICRTCPATHWCTATVNPRYDDGVRGGVVLPTIHDSDRRSPYPGGLPPQRVGRVPAGEPGALAACDVCGQAMQPKSILRHRRTVHGATQHVQAMA